MVTDTGGDEDGGDAVTRAARESGWAWGWVRDAVTPDAAHQSWSGLCAQYVLSRSCCVVRIAKSRFVVCDMHVHTHEIYEGALILTLNNVNNSKHLPTQNNVKRFSQHSGNVETQN